MTRDVTDKFCAMCDNPISGKRKYCSDACKQAAHRARHGSETHERQQGQEIAAPSVTIRVTVEGEPDRPPCARPDCNNPTARGKRARWLTYCSEGCKQKHKREKGLEAKKRWHYNR